MGYEKDIHRFNIGEAVKVSVLYFNSFGNAVRGLEFLRNNSTVKLDKTTAGQGDLPGLKNVESNIIVRYGCEKFEPKVVEKIFEIGDELIPIPVRINSMLFAVIRREERLGMRIRYCKKDMKQ